MADILFCTLWGLPRVFRPLKFTSSRAFKGLTLSFHVGNYLGKKPDWTTCLEREGELDKHVKNVLYGIERYSNSNLLSTAHQLEVLADVAYAER